MKCESNCETTENHASQTTRSNPGVKLTHLAFWGWPYSFSKKSQRLLVLETTMRYLQWGSVLSVSTRFLWYIEFENNLLSQTILGRTIHWTKKSIESEPDFVRELFPECLSTIHSHEGSIAFYLNKTLKYVPSNHTPRYDHLSCPVMKARYNCAGFPPDSVNYERATDYKLVSVDENNMECDFRELIDVVGGPVGVAKYLLEKVVPERNATEVPIKVLIQGNSYLRQVWEALVCSYSDQITDLKLLRNGPPISTASTAARAGALIPIDEMGQMIEGKEGIDNIWNAGCHSGKSLDNFFWPGEQVPSTDPSCTDNVGMVEFSSLIRFYYIFHPSQFTKEARTDLYHSQLSIGSSVDVLLWNNKEWDTPSSLSVKRNISIDSLLPTVRKAQQKSIRRVFGANNPWITHPPDNVSYPTITLGHPSEKLSSDLKH